nr:aspartate kinase [uncultured Capnocytophaga sp.]
MQVYKFGGASVKDAQSVRNVFSILEKTEKKDILIVISAMGKTTNALEEVVESYFKDKNSSEQSLQKVKDFHYTIIDELFEDKNHPIYRKIDGLFGEITSFIERNKSPKHSFVYDQIVSVGELLSTTIISYYLNDRGIRNIWLDGRNLVRTNSNYREAEIDWEETKRNICDSIKHSLMYITQGFIGSDSNYFTTTLGREGSDYSAAIFAYCLQAESVTIWKDVAGVLNADPRYFKQTRLLEKIPYQEAIELAFYGASVIHPKTLQPLQKMEIPLNVRSFLNPEAKGSSVCKINELTPKIPCYIRKQNQHLLSLSSLDFSFIGEENISFIFNLLATYQIKVSLLQNSAISFNICIEDKFKNLHFLLEKLREKFKVECIENVILYTIRHSSNEDSFEFLDDQKEILLEQFALNTLQKIVRE